MDNLNQDLTSLLRRAGLDNSGGEWGSRILLVAGIVLICYLAVNLFRHLVTPALQRISAQTRTMWDDHLFDDKVLHAACRLIPPVLLYLLLPLAFGDDPSLLKLLHKGCSIYLIVVTIALLNTFLSALYDISNKHETLRDRPLKGIYQMLKLVTVSVGIVLIIGILIDRNATSILAGLGASAAMLMLIFKDSILGLVAGVQLSANDMLRPGDWITMSKYGADGYVIEVTLTTVKVQNFDKTITTIPPYALVSDSFQNWRGMRECGGRRIKRSVFIDAGRDGAAPRKGVSCGRYIAGNRQPASAAGVSRELPEQLPRRAQRPDVDGTHAPTHVRRRAFGVLLLHAPLRMDSLRSVPERTYRPCAHPSAGVRLAGVPAACGHRSA